MKETDSSECMDEGGGACQPASQNPGQHVPSFPASHLLLVSQVNDKPRPVVTTLKPVAIPEETLLTVSAALWNENQRILNFRNIYDMFYRNSPSFKLMSQTSPVAADIEC